MRQLLAAVFGGPAVAGVQAVKRQFRRTLQAASSPLIFLELKAQSHAFLVGSQFVICGKMVR